MKELRETSTSSNNEKRKQIDLSRLWSKRSVDEYGKPTERLELASVSTPENPKLLGGHVKPYIHKACDNNSDSDENHPLDDLYAQTLERVINNGEAPRAFRNRLTLILGALGVNMGQIRQSGINAYDELIAQHGSHENIVAEIRRYDPNPASD